MSLLTGPGRNSEMSMMMSSNLSRGNLPTSSRWPGDSIWKQPSVFVLWISAYVVGSSRGTCDSSSMSMLDPADPGHLGDGMRHRRLHPDAEHVELEQPEVLDVLLVELAHRVAEEARLDGRPVEQRGIGQQHAARVHGDVPRQPVELLDQLEQQVEAAVAQAGRRQAHRPQLGQLPDRRSGRRGPGCAGTPWRSGRSHRAACRAPPRRRGPHGAPGRCPSSRRRRSGCRCSARGSRS